MTVIDYDGYLNKMATQFDGALVLVDFSILLWKHARQLLCAITRRLQEHFFLTSL